MSGISVAAGQRLQPETHVNGPGPETGEAALFKVSFLQIQLLAYVCVFLVSGLVPFEEIATAVFLSFYLVFLSLYIFPNKSHERIPGLFNMKKILPAYAALGTIIGLFLPLAYVLGGFTRADQAAVQSAVPQLFLFCCQMLTENVVVDLHWVTLPVRALVPLLYTARRLVTINMWLRDEFAEEPFSLNVPVWNLFGRALAVANGAFWGFNVFVFILPMFIPRAFEKHFQMQHDAQQAAFKGEPRDVKPQTPAGESHPEPEGKPTFFGELRKKLI